jgi:hypothetical protein
VREVIVTDEVVTCNCGRLRVSVSSLGPHRLTDIRCWECPRPLSRWQQILAYVGGLYR